MAYSCEVTGVHYWHGHTRGSEEAHMASTPDRGDSVTAELSATSERLRARRTELTIAGGSHQATTDGLEAGRAELRRGRSGLDPATIDRLRRPS
jgi:hypothetical protein